MTQLFRPIALFAVCTAVLLSTPCRADNDALTALYNADQADRDASNPDWNGKKIDWPIVRERDAARRANTMKLVQSGQLRSANDYYHACVVFQHGETLEDYRLAHSLAVLASTLDPSLADAKFLVAASWDRMMLKANQPQWYGTQYQRLNGSEKWGLYQIDELVVTDEERAKLGVPSLQEAKRKLAELNAH